MFHWGDFLGVMVPVEIIRSWTHGSKEYLPTWVVYSLPFALWVSSYLFFIRGIWWRSSSRIQYIWFWCIPVIAVTAELCQSLRILPGTFDLQDLLTISLAVALVPRTQVMFCKTEI